MDDNNGDDSFMSTCIACEDANQETKDKYDMEWCLDMVPSEQLRGKHTAWCLNLIDILKNAVSAKIVIKCYDLILHKSTETGPCFGEAPVMRIFFDMIY